MGGLVAVDKAPSVLRRRRRKGDQPRTGARTSHEVGGRTVLIELCPRRMKMDHYHDDIS